jgi:hypothetical protein
VRVTFFQGAPLVDELNNEPTDLASFDDWSFPLAPLSAGTATTAMATHGSTINTSASTNAGKIISVEEHDESLL